MHKIIILAYCAASISSSAYLNSSISQKIETTTNKIVNLLNKSDKVINKSLNYSYLTRHNKTNGFNNKTLYVKYEKHKMDNGQKSKDNQNSLPFLHKIHARITRSKDAVWATITLTFMCVLLVLAVAHSRMWKDHHYSESQGVPLPNFNERVLFKDVMERKVSSLKQFFKKKSKEKNVTELESLLPPSEWD